MVRVTVIGGGVSGIGTSLALLEKVPKCDVTIVAENFTPRTTGDGAAGMWGPFISGDTPEEKIIKWSQDTWNLFLSWWKSGEPWGVSLVPGTSVDKTETSISAIPWSHIPFGFKWMSQEECRKYGPDYVSGYEFTTFFAEPSKFLPRLHKEIESRGGRFINRRVKSLEDVGKDTDLIINCSGLGSYYIVPDTKMYPVRGQVMRVRAPWLSKYLCDESEDSFAYILPNEDTGVLGGTQQENNWNTDINETDSYNIWKNCTNIMPQLKAVEIVREWVGLRPTRKGGVRIEEESITIDSRKIPVVHNYGHSGCGVTFFWGCGMEAAQIAADIIHRDYIPISKL